MTLNIRSVIEWLVLLGTSAGTATGNINHLKKEITKKLNVVVFLADDLGYGDLGCYGNPIIKTPCLDAFAKQGVILTDCHSGGTTCSPSRASLLTGRNPYRSGFYYIQGGNTFLASSEVTIPEVLKAKGYESCFVGKWHLSVLEKGKVKQPDPGDQGFDYWMGTTHNPFEGPENPEKFVRDGTKVNNVKGWFCDVIVDEASYWLKEKRDKTKPFFLYVASHEPHTPLAPPDSYRDKYNSTRVDSLEKTISYGGIKRSERDISANKVDYYGTVSQLDNAFGNLIKTIDELGLGGNTLIIFTSDNGPETPVTIEESLGKWEDPIRDKCFGTPGLLRGMKRFPYEGGHRVPGIVRLPGVIRAGSHSNQLFNGTDILPTICKLIDAPLPQGITIDGSANFEAFVNKKIARKIPAIWFYPNHEDSYFRMPQMSMRYDHYTLIGWLPPKPDALNLNTWFFENGPVKFELYDIKKDPGQQIDLVTQYPVMVSFLSRKMKQLWVEMRDEGKIK